MPTASPDAPVAQLVTDRPVRARVFEHLGIDYCCRGDHSLAEACRKNDLDPKTVGRMLDAVTLPAFTAETDWTEAPLGALIDHIIGTHHAFLRRELPALEALLRRVVAAHRAEVDWLAPVLEVFQALKLGLEPHMMTEEERVFPSIRALTTAASDEGRGASLDVGGIDAMITEHDDAGAAVERLRSLTNDYTPPEDACPTFRSALDRLRELEIDLHQHIHKENNILFPRARSLAQ
ncbi:MAG: iron-sulfur cluster repair di-iron protein [Salinibacter sp.]